METQDKTIHEVLTDIQSILKAPKNQRNKFGGYNFRSCEDIVEAVKPILKQFNCNLTLNDDIIEIGGRIYVKAIATFTYKKDRIEVFGFAREEENKKGFDAMQLTGATSSYARKYALNGLFLIDDTKDSDFTNQGEEKKVINQPIKKELIALSDEQIDYAINEGKQTQVLMNVGIKYNITQAQKDKLENARLNSINTAIEGAKKTISTKTKEK